MLLDGPRSILSPHVSGGASEGRSGVGFTPLVRTSDLPICSTAP